MTGPTLSRVESGYYLAPAAAHVRASLPGHRDSPDGQLLRIGLAAGVRLSAFKRSQPLPRVGAVLGALRSIRPTDLLDVGSGRGVFLWPLLDAFPDLTVTAAEIDGHRAAALALVTRGGLERLRVVRTDVQALGLTTDSFDVVTFLEVLEHLGDPRV